MICLKHSMHFYLFWTSFCTCFKINELTKIGLSPCYFWWHKNIWNFKNPRLPMASLWNYESPSIFSANFSLAEKPPIYLFSRPRACFKSFPVVCWKAKGFSEKPPCHLQPPTEKLLGGASLAVRRPPRAKMWATAECPPILCVVECR